jgi:hypothetical protein
MKDINMFKIFYSFPAIFLMLNIVYALGQGSIRGRVVDFTTKEPLSGVNVFLSGTYYGTTTDDDGYYYLGNISEGKYEIIFSMIGYEKQEIDFVIKKNETIIFDRFLNINPIQLSKVQIFAKKYDNLRLSNRSIKIKNISIMPTLGEQDVFHAVQTLPGIITTDDYTKKLYIRGGDANQTTVLLDDLPMYNSLHIIGLFSPFHIDAIDKAQLITGGFSVKHGESASGVFELNTKEEVENFAANVDLTLINTKAFLEGKINRMKYIMALRRSYTDLVFPIITGYPFPVTISDALGKLSFDINRYNKICFLGYYSNDNIKDYDTDNSLTEKDLISEYSWGNKAANLQWKFSKNKYFWEFQMGLSINTMKSPIYGQFNVNNRIQNLIVRFDNKYLMSEKCLISWGFNLYNNYYNYYWYLEDYDKYQESEYLQDDLYWTRETYRFFDFAPLQYNKEFSISIPSLYFEYTGKPNIPTTFVIGIRYTPSSAKLYSAIEPRLHITYQVNKNISLKGNISRHSQYTTTAKDIGGFDFSFAGMLNAYDAWFPLLKPYKPVISDHFITGIQWNIKNLIRINIEGYYKTFKNLVASVDSIPNFTQGKGHAEGVEVLIEKQTPRTNTFLSYTLSRTVKNIHGEIFYPGYDKRHDLDAQISIKLPKNYTIAFHAKWCTGTPYTTIVGESYTRYYNGWHFRRIEYIRGPKNAVRYPDYTRLDFQLVKNTKLFKKRAELFFQIFNITNQSNILYYNDLRATGVARERSFKNDYHKQLPIIPSIGMKIYF